MNNSNQKEALLWRLRLVFLYYSSYADRNNYKSLKSQNYRRFLIDSQAVTDNASFPPFDIAFRKIHTSAITLSQFQELLPTIARKMTQDLELVYPKKTRKEAFKLFMGLHMQKLYSEILKRSEFGSDIILLQNLKIADTCLELLDSTPIHRAYQTYIQSTSMHQKQPEQTFQQVHLFLSDFEVSPKLVYKAMVYLAFFQLLKINNSLSWGLLDFQKLIIALAELYWRRNDDSNVRQQEKVLRLLQHMETSEGFKRMVDKNLKENAVLISFFKRPTRLSTQLKQSRQLNASLEKEQPKSTRNVENSRYFSAKRSRYNDDAPVKGLLFEEGEVAMKMSAIFERLCSHGQVGNTHTLKSIKIKRYFNSLNIMAPLEQTWVDITISELCRTSPSGKIEFSHFLQLVKLAAQKLKIANETLLHYLIEESHHEIESGKEYFSANKTQAQKQQHSQEVLFHVQKPLERIFNYYKKGKKGLSFDQLCHLLFEFEIFPAFVTKAKLYTFFQARSKAANTLKKLMGEILLDLRGYIEVLSDISHEISDNLTEQERTLFLLERMQDSQGHKNVLGTQGTNLIGDLRAKYAAVYKQNLLKQSPAKAEGFKQLLDQYETS